MPKLTGTWGVCSSDLDSFGGGPDEQPIGPNLWLTLGSDVCLQGRPELKPEERELAAAHARADGTTVVVADEVDGRMWQGEEECFGEFQLLRESALAAHAQAQQVKTEAVARQAERDAAAWKVEERHPLASQMPEETPDQLPAEVAPTGMMMAEEWSAVGMVAEDEQLHAEMAMREADLGLAESFMPEAQVETMAGKLSEDEAKHAWLAARGLNVPLWGPERDHVY